MKCHAIAVTPLSFSAQNRRQETVQNDHTGSTLFRNPRQFKVLGQKMDALRKQTGEQPIRLCTIGDANATDAFLANVGVLGFRHLFLPGSDKETYQQRVLTSTQQLPKQFVVTRYDKNSEPKSLKRGEFDVDEFVMRPDGSLQASGLVHPFLTLLKIDAKRQGPFRGLPPTKFRLRPEAKPLLGQLVQGDVNQTIRNLPVTPSVFTVMNMIESVEDPERLASEIAQASTADSLIALGSNELFESPKAAAFRAGLTQGGFKPTRTPETEPFLELMRAAALQLPGENRFALIDWLWQKDK